MEISTQYLQQADENMQTRQHGTRQEPGADDRDKFEQVMQNEGEGQQRQESVPGSNAPSPSSLMESLFGQRLSDIHGGPSAAVGEAAPASRLNELVDKLVDSILVSEPGKGDPEVRLSLGEGLLKGAELRLTRAADGLLSVHLSCPDVNAFQTAVGAQDSLRTALERTGEQVRIEVNRGGAEGGNEGDSKRRSTGYMEEIEDV
ncbi:MAG: hypothetical protein IJD16_06640 [Desulfovibrio sp.]|nr:hypothetical protein [Desulfovibrio sp.]